MYTTNTSKLFDTVVKGGYCIGCGACASVKDSPIKIKLNEYSQFTATIEGSISDSLDNKLMSVCPFSDESKNEDELGNELFGDVAQYKDKIGYYIKNYAGHVSEKGFRERGSSGGMGSWILKSLLSRGLIDGVVHVKDRNPTKGDNRLFSFQISTTVEEVNEGAKSKYYSVELSEMLIAIKSLKGRYAIVGIPCFIKSIRLLAKQDEVLNEKIKFCVGLICGHLKTSGFAEILAWQNGIHPHEMTKIDFRTKLEGYGANQYGVTVDGIVKGKRITKVSKPVSQLYGTNWGHGFFKYKACDYCDDVLAETADITIGDAWLPQYLKEGKGTNVITVRNPLLLKLIEEEKLIGNLDIEELDFNDVIKSQNSGLLHRREGLSYRLLQADKRGDWRPKKRVEPGVFIDERSVKIQDLRIIIASESHKALKNALKENSYKAFKKQMDSFIGPYNKLYKVAFYKKVIRKFKNLKK